MNSDIRAIVEEIHGTSTLASIVVAGAGTQAISWLLGVAGASRTVLEIQVPYASSAFTEFTGYEPEQFVSAGAARGLARAAYRRALHLRQDDTPVVGVACTATIATDRPKRGEHRCHIALWSAQGVYSYNLTFVKGLRDRDGEDFLASAIILNGLATASGVDKTLPLDLDAFEKVEIEATEYEDPIKALLAEHVESVTIDAAGNMIADAPVSGGVLPGSFNPLHDGHEALASIASELLGAEVSFELSVVNVDKPPLEEGEIRRRVAQFAGKGSIVLTRVPVFYKKGRIFPGVAFIIGWDTAVRLVESKYYDDQQSKMLMALEELRQLGCRFLVAGRAEDDKFHTLAEVSIPEGLEDLFIEIPESAFRSDLSSTELRLSGRSA